MICNVCGKPIDDDSKFCPHCGATIGSAANQVSTEPIPVPNEIPTFTPPSDDIPTFTAPGSAGTTVGLDGSKIPTFSAPRSPRGNGKMCYYHPDEPAVDSCARCGKPLCEDCCDSYGVAKGQYAGRHLCYDCTQELVKDNISTLQENYATIKGQYTVCLIGTAIGGIGGFVYGLASGDFLAALVCLVFFGAIGGSFVNFIKRFVSAIPSFFVSTGNMVLSITIGVIKMCVLYFVYAIMALFETIKKILYYRNYMQQTAGFIESDTAALQRMNDYMEYTMIRNKNRGMSLESLMQEGSQLYNNSFAQMVRDQGEEQAEAAMSQCVTRIAENGEIIRSFAA